MCIKHSPRPQDTHIAINSAILAAGNKEECGECPPRLLQFHPGALSPSLAPICPAAQ